MQRNGYFAHREYALIAMLGDDNENVRNIGVKMLERRKKIAEGSANNHDCPLALDSNLIRLFDEPTPHLANAYYEFANFDSYQQKPPTIVSLAHTEIEQCLRKPLVLRYLYGIVNLWSGTSNLLRKRLHKLKDFINNENEMSYWTKN